MDRFWHKDPPLKLEHLFHHQRGMKYVRRVTNSISVLHLKQKYVLEVLQYWNDIMHQPHLPTDGKIYSCFVKHGKYIKIQEEYIITMIEWLIYCIPCNNTFGFSYLLLKDIVQYEIWVALLHGFIFGTCRNTRLETKQCVCKLIMYSMFEFIYLSYKFINWLF